MLKKIGQFLNKKEYNYNQSKRGIPLSFIELIKDWPQIVGKNLSEVTLPQRISRNTLYIVVNHSLYAEHLRLMEQELIHKIHQFSPALRRDFHKLKFFFSEEAFKEQAQYKNEQKSKDFKKISFNKFDPEVKKKLEKAEIVFKDCDPEIKDSLISIYIQSLDK